MAKEVFVLLRHSPYSSSRTNEGLRMSVGQTMADNRITVALVDNAVLAAFPVTEAPPGLTPVSKHIEMLNLLGHRVLASRESLERFPVDSSAVLAGVEVVGEADIANAMAQADAVICY